MVVTLLYDPSAFPVARLSSISASATVPPYLGGYLPYDLHYRSPVLSLSTPMSTNPSPELKSLFEAALNEFEKRAGTNLVRHQIIDKLVNCESADSVIDVLQEQAQAFRNFRGDDGKLMMWLKRTVNVLYTLSTSDVVCEGISLVCVYSFLWRVVPCNISLLQPFPPAKAIFAGIAMLLGVSALHEFDVT